MGMGKPSSERIEVLHVEGDEADSRRLMTWERVGVRNELEATRVRS